MINFLKFFPEFRPKPEKSGFSKKKNILLNNFFFIFCLFLQKYMSLIHSLIFFLFKCPANSIPFAMQKVRYSTPITFRFVSLLFIKKSSLRPRTYRAFFTRFGRSATLHCCAIPVCFIQSKQTFSSYF